MEGNKVELSFDGLSLLDGTYFVDINTAVQLRWKAQEEVFTPSAGDYVIAYLVDFDLATEHLYYSVVNKYKYVGELDAASRSGVLRFTMFKYGFIRFKYFSSAGLLVGTSSVLVVGPQVRITPSYADDSGEATLTVTLMHGNMPPSAQVDLFDITHRTVLRAHSIPSAAIFSECTLPFTLPKGPAAVSNLTFRFSPVSGTVTFALPCKLLYSLSDPSLGEETVLARMHDVLCIGRDVGLSAAIREMANDVVIIAGTYPVVRRSVLTSLYSLGWYIFMRFWMMPYAVSLVVTPITGGMDIVARIALFFVWKLAGDIALRASISVIGSLMVKLAKLSQRDQVDMALEFMELSRPLDRAAVRSRYRELALRYHPDRGGDTESFSKLQVYHQIVLDACPKDTVEK